ncbi:MAG: hypothetical protein QGG39_11580 [Candidatus Poribacteria bacterium]|nr:hypothetical protein [Candidatus Poribacteria bacterium]
METYGCKRVKNKDIPRWILRKIKRLELNPPLKVPMRQNGMTSTGKPLMCHPNVAQLVHKYGGERMIGYMIWSTGDFTFYLASHSVWITPEGKMVDVTKKTDKQSKDRLEPDTTIEFFIPVTTNPNVLLKAVDVHKDDRLGSFLEEMPHTPRHARGSDSHKLSGLPKLKDLVVEVSDFGSYFGRKGNYWEAGSFDKNGTSPFLGKNGLLPGLGG